MVSDVVRAMAVKAQARLMKKVQMDRSDTKTAPLVVLMRVTGAMIQKAMWWVLMARSGANDAPVARDLVLGRTPMVVMKVAKQDLKAMGTMLAKRA